jgi:uncharacterized SAM-binding protein YcdF (DUF218 family)
MGGIINGTSFGEALWLRAKLNVEVGGGARWFDFVQFLPPQAEQVTFVTAPARRGLHRGPGREVSHQHISATFVKRTGLFCFRVSILGIILLALFAGWLTRLQILRGAARAWVVSDSIERSDAIAVLGGGLETRPFAAGELYKRGFAKQILISDVRPPGPTEKQKPIYSHAEENRAVLLKLGVPSEAIINFGTDLSNTYEEAHALARWAEIKGIKSVIVPTEIFSSRRVRWILNRELSSVGARVEVLALSPREYDTDNWWRDKSLWHVRSREGVIAFRDEVAKYLYYRIRY